MAQAQTAIPGVKRNGNAYSADTTYTPPTIPRNAPAQLILKPLQAGVPRPAPDPALGGSPFAALGQVKPRSRPEGYAKGSKGPIKGPGTTTSDSIPARLSKDEVVLNAGAGAALQKMLGKTTIEQFNAQYAPQGAETSMEDGVVKAAAGLPDKKKPLDLNYVQQTPGIEQAWLPDPAAKAARHEALAGGVNQVKNAIQAVPSQVGGVIRDTAQNMKKTALLPLKTLIGQQGINEAEGTAQVVGENVASGLNQTGEAYNAGAKNRGVVGGLYSLGEAAFTNNAADTATPQVTKPPTLAQPGAMQPAANPDQPKPGTMQPAATQADETQIPYLGAKGQKVISNPDGTNTTITNANRLSNRVVGGMPVTMASEDIAANGDRSYVIPGDNGNASRMNIHQTGTDARGNGNFAVSYGKGQKGTVSASPELMKRYQENKGSFGVADMSKVPHYEEPQQQQLPQQQTPQAPQPQAPDYSGQIAELMAQMPETSRFDSVGTLIAKKQQRKAIESKLAALTGMQESGNRLASENARLGVSQNQFNQSRQDAQAREARDANQQQWTNAKEANAVDYLHERNLKADQAATAKAQADAELENRKLGQPKPITTNTYDDNGAVNGQQVGVVQYDEQGTPSYKSLGGQQKTAAPAAALAALKKEPNRIEEFVRMYGYRPAGY